MTVEQIDTFFRETVDRRIKWEIIRILGGEPTLHPDIMDILHLAVRYKKGHSPDTRLMLVTNGAGEKARDVLSRVSSAIEIENTRKRSSTHEHFQNFNMAPIDDLENRGRNYSGGCWTVWLCGIGLTPYGFYPCAIAGGIDRVLGLDKGRKSLPAPDDSMTDLLEILCPYCGVLNSQHQGKKELMSAAWRRAYREYKVEPPQLSRY
jgi:hypothetical protein